MALLLPAFRRRGSQGNAYCRIALAKPVVRAGSILELESEESTITSAELPTAVEERKP